MRRRRTFRGLVLGVLVAVAGCDHGVKNGYFVKGWLKYRVATPDPALWTPISSEGNDLAWVNSKTGHVLAMNSTCVDHADPGLDVLTTHLLFGFTEKELKKRETKMVDGREALLSNYAAKLDGVPMEIDLAVLKKNDCVHDFMYVAPAGRAAEFKPVFDQLLTEFTAEKVE